MRIGIYGGTFNPPHTGHLRLAEEMLEEASLDKIIVIPASTPPHKSDYGLISEEHRSQSGNCSFIYTYARDDKYGFVLKD